MTFTTVVARLDGEVEERTAIMRSPFLGRYESTLTPDPKVSQLLQRSSGHVTVLEGVHPCVKDPWKVSAGPRSRWRIRATNAPATAPSPSNNVRSIVSNTTRATELSERT
jgi:hypothetical protein